MTNSKWLSSRKQENWDDFVEVCPAEAKKCDKVPNWARRSLGLTNTLGRAPMAFPLALQHKTDEILLQKLQYGMEVSPAGISDMISELLQEYNAQVREVNNELQALAEQDRCEDEARLLPLATCKITKGNMDKLAERFARRFAWNTFRNEKPGRHLDFNDVQLVQIRQFIATSIKSGRIHERLIGNFDQVWTLCYEPLKKIAFKQQIRQGERALGECMPRKASFIEGLREKAGLLPSTLVCASCSVVCIFQNLLFPDMFGYVHSNSC